MPMPRKPLQQYNVGLPKDAIRRLHQLARLQDVSVAYLIRQAVIRYIETAEEDNTRV